jgi:radical SAM protein with 4Fe4S-binding SPASM domain
MQCPSIPEIDIAEWGEGLNSRLEGKRYPYSATFEITDRCNLDCVHCYINRPAGSKSARSNELSTDAVKYILDQIAEAGCLFLTLTGGDPLLRSDFPEIYHHARRLGMVVSIFTNGTLITPEIADLLAAYTPRVVDITLYGATAQTYELVTRMPGSFARVQRGIQLLRERQVPFSLKTMVLTVNQHEFDDMKAFAEGLGVKFRYDGLLWPRLDGNPAPLEFQIPLEDLIAFEFRNQEIQKEWLRLSQRFEGQVTRREREFSCGIGRRCFHIDSQGMLGGCMSVRRPAYDLKKMPFLEGWKQLGELPLLKRQLDTPCRSCTLNDLCNQCPGWSQAVHGDDETPVAFICELAHLREESVQKFKFCYNYVSNNEEVCSYG